MDNSRTEVLPHPQYLEILFAFKNTLTHVFKTVLGNHSIHHIAISHINKSQQLVTLSSTPALEYNLFSSNLWPYDQTYNPQWYSRCTHASWENLYSPSRYDELFYLKQIRHNYPIGLSLATEVYHEPLIFSFASHNNCQETKEYFLRSQEQLYAIGHHCFAKLSSLFHDVHHVSLEW